MRYLDEDLYADIDFGRDEETAAYGLESGLFRIESSVL